MHINYKENIRLAIESISSNRLRTSLTVLIIAFGIMALVGILTSIEAIKTSFSNNMSAMGANSFTIKNNTGNIIIGGKHIKGKQNSPLKWKDVKRFQEQYTVNAKVAISVHGTGSATLKFKSEKTHPNVSVEGVDQNYIFTSAEKIAKGRNFSDIEIQSGSPVTIIGNAVAASLFKQNENPLGQIISIGSHKYKVIGILEKKGNSFGFSGDRSVWLPINNVRQYFSRSKMSYKIHILPSTNTNIDMAVGEATGLFRQIRKDPLGEEDSFSIERSDKLERIAMEQIDGIGYAASFIGLITIIGSAIGLMNIMLVSVSERTREIGIRKALGATAKVIKFQFLIEAIVIAQIGGAVGIILGIAIGNIVSSLIGSSFIIPWAWILLSLLLCVGVALLSGILPARKAAALDPIESLRYE